MIATQIYSGIVGTTYAWDYFDDTVYFSDGIVCKKIVNGTVTNWGMEPPSEPTLSSTSGSLSSGVYLAACVWVDALGKESGVSSIASIELSDNSGIVFSNLPMIIDPQVISLRLYLSTANGKELYHVADTTSLTYTISAGRYDDSNILEGQFASNPPPGRIIRHYNGRSYIADAYGAVYYSEPFSFDLFKLGDSFIQFPEAVSIMEPVTGGIYFATDNETWLYRGNPEDGFDIVRQFDYGGVYGTGRRVPNSDNVVWQSQRGMILGTSERATNMQEKHVAVESAVSGATLIREQDGVRQYIASIHQPTTSRMAATSWIDAEVIRRA